MTIQTKTERKAAFRDGVAKAKAELEALTRAAFAERCPAEPSACYATREWWLDVKGHLRGEPEAVQRVYAVVDSSWSPEMVAEWWEKWNVGRVVNLAPTSGEYVEAKRMGPHARRYAVPRMRARQAILDVFQGHPSAGGIIEPPTRVLGLPARDLAYEAAKFLGVHPDEMLEAVEEMLASGVLVEHDGLVWLRGSFGERGKRQNYFMRWKKSDIELLGRVLQNLGSIVRAAEAGNDADVDNLANVIASLQRVAGNARNFSTEEEATAGGYSDERDRAGRDAERLKVEIGS